MIKTSRIFKLVFVYSAFFASCSVYQSEGRKNFETQVLRSPNIALNAVDLQNCSNFGAHELSLDATNSMEINDQQRMTYDHPILNILTDLSESTIQLCRYQVNRDPLNNNELLQLIEGINHE